MERRDLFLVVAVLVATAFALFLFNAIPGYSRPPSDMNVLRFWIVFVVFNLIFIGVPAGIHKIYVGDYGKIKGVWFFALFGGITGGLLGEASFVMIVPYTLLMFVYAFLYKKFTWWKVALTSYLAGILIENGLNHAPIQPPTLMWVAFFVYPYFFTKMFENRKKMKGIFWDMKWAFVFSILLGALAVYFSKNNISPPLIILGLVLPFIVWVGWKVFHRNIQIRFCFL